MAVFQVGDVKVRSIWEIDEDTFKLSSFFPLSDPASVAAEVGWMAPKHYDVSTGCLKMSIHSWLIETARSKILIDTCIGNGKERYARTQWSNLNTRFLERLAEAGVSPEEIDYVFCTHLHADHVGWNTRLIDDRWVPTFPRAKYIFSRAEHDYWEELFARSDPASHHFASYVDSVLPVLKAGQALIVDDGFEIDGCLTVAPAHGHTPGHIAIWLSSQGSRGVFSGDVIHHPIQLRHPEWSCMGCKDPKQSSETRSRLLGQVSDANTYLFTGHFTAPHAVLVERMDEAFSFKFACEEC